MQRYGLVLGIKPEHVAEYERLHAAVWPEVLATIHDCNIRNYSIFRYGDLLQRLGRHEAAAQVFNEVIKHATRFASSVEDEERWASAARQAITS